MKNKSALTFHVKLATISERCYKTVQNVMDMYQSGVLQRKKTSDFPLAIHATYFDFLYNFNVMEQEDEVYQLWASFERLEQCRPVRR